MKNGVYMGPNGQLVLVYQYKEPDAWFGEKTLKASDDQGFWLERGSMASEMLYLIDGYEYLGDL